jgi:tRNA threonylcarbamoyladenosine biosynthesis protein TsaB
VLVLALDTTSRSGSAAVVRDSELLGEIVGDQSRNHAERLPGELMRVLEIAAVSLEAIDLLAVAAGPGSFTGLRVGIAAMQGLAMATNRKIVPVSALDALAVAGADPDADASGTVAAWIDAQRGQVFASLYYAGGVRALREPSSLTPMETLDAWGHALSGGTVRFIGDGAARYEAVIHERLGPAARILSTPPLAGIVGRLAAAAPESALLPHAIVPIYIRRPDVELARSRRAE